MRNDVNFKIQYSINSSGTVEQLDNEIVQQLEKELTTPLQLLYNFQQLSAQGF